MICYSPENTSDVEGGNKFHDLNNESQAEISRELEDFEHRNDQNSVTDYVNIEEDDKDDLLSTNYKAQNLKKGDIIASRKTTKSMKWAKQNMKQKPTPTFHIILHSSIHSTSFIIYFNSDS